MSNTDDELILFMATLGWIYGKYDDQCFHIFEESGSNTMTKTQAEAIKAYTDTKMLKARLVELDLLEQAINLGQDINEFKMYRLGELTAQLKGDK